MSPPRLRLTVCIACCLAVLAGLAAGPAFAGGPGAVTLSVTPSRLVLEGATQTVVSVTNSGTARTAIDVTLGNYVIRPDGEVVVDPRLPPGRSAKRWLKAVPSRVDLAPGQSARITVTSRPARSAQPGDHHALLLFTTVPRTSGGVAVRTRVGVTALVRVDGPLVRRLRPLGLSVTPRGGDRLVRLRLANRGNVYERFVTTRTLLELRKNGKVIARLHAPTRSILPGTSGHLVFRYRGRITGAVNAIVRVRPTPAAQAGPGITSTPATIVVRRTVRL
jgi:hypothetical protein